MFPASDSNYPVANLGAANASEWKIVWPAMRFFVYRTGEWAQDHLERANALLVQQLLYADGARRSAGNHYGGQ